MTSSEGKVLKRSSPKTIHDKFLVIYDAEYTCPGDGRPIPGNLAGWNRWFQNNNGVLEPRFDLFPDVSEYSPPELFKAPTLPLHHNEVAKLFSSRHPKTIQRHFHWMAKHSIDGAFLKRKAAALETHGVYDSPKAEWTKWRDDLGQLVEYAAEREDRVFAIMYDLAGLADNLISQTILTDWGHLIRNQAIIDSSAYLREDGRAVIMLRGYEYSTSSHLEVIIRTVQELRSMTPGGVYVILAVPSEWRDKSNPSALGVRLSPLIEDETGIDAICPDGLPPIPDQHSLEDYADREIHDDTQYLRDLHERGGRKVEYLPTVWSGFSARNSSNGYFGLNTIKRDGGKVLWNQVWQAKRAGCRTVLCSSWDAYNNGTAVLPVVSSKRMLPTSGQFLALDADGGDLPPDWYMRVCGMAAEGFHNERRVLETFPVKELQDYWSSRPKYEVAKEKEEEKPTSSTASQPLSEKTGEPSDEPPPPPYTLEPSASVSNEPQPVSDVPSSSSSTAEHDPHVGTVSSPGVPPSQPPVVSPTPATTGHDQAEHRQQSIGSLTSYPSSSSSISANLSHSSTPLSHLSTPPSHHSNTTDGTSTSSYFPHISGNAQDVGNLADRFGQQKLSEQPQVWPPPEWGVKPSPQGNPAPWGPQQQGGSGQYAYHPSPPSGIAPQMTNPEQYGGPGHAYTHGPMSPVGVASPPIVARALPGPYAPVQSVPSPPASNSHQQHQYTGSGQFGYNQTMSPSPGSPPPPGGQIYQPQHSQTLAYGGSYPQSSQPMGGGGSYFPPPHAQAGPPPPHQTQWGPQAQAPLPHQGYGSSSTTPPHQAYGSSGPPPQPSRPPAQHAQSLPSPPGGYSPNEGGRPGPAYQGQLQQQQSPYGYPAQQQYGYTPHPMIGNIQSPGAPPPQASLGLGSGNFSLNGARHTFDRYAGEDVLKQLERGADDIFKSGSKLFNKFTK